jgi:hypothetical protein
MRGRKWTITLVLVVLMIIGTAVSAYFSRRSVRAEQERVRDAVARTYGNQNADVRSCAVAPTPTTEANTLNPRARYRCVVVVAGCRHSRLFSVPLVGGSTPEDAIARPLERRRCR